MRLTILFKNLKSDKKMFALKMLDKKNVVCREKPRCAFHPINFGAMLLHNRTKRYIGGKYQSKMSGLVIGLLKQNSSLFVIRYIENQFL